MINKYNTPGGSYTTERILVNYINENRVATPFGITTLFCHVSILIATSYTVHFTPYTLHYKLFTFHYSLLTVW